MKPGDWACPSCDYNVFARKTECPKCGEPKPGGGGFDDYGDNSRFDYGGGGGGGRFEGGGGGNFGYVRQAGDDAPVDVAAVEALIEERAAAPRARLRRGGRGARPPQV